LKTGKSGVVYVSEKDWKRWVAAISGLICGGVAVLVAPNVFSKYSLDPEHLLSHSIYNALIILCAILLIRGKIPEFFDRLLPIRKIHTGNLNLNMLGFLAGFIICLLSLLGFTSF